MDGEEHGATPAQPPGETTRAHREDLGASGWTTTKQAAKVLGVSRRSVQGYVGRGMLEAREEGEGVNRRFLVSIDSLNALVERRRREASEAANFVEASPLEEEATNAFAKSGEELRHLIERLEARTEEATELRIRLELTERAQSTLEDERRAALEELEDARRRQEEIERERDELRRELEALKEAREDAPESLESPVSTHTPPQDGGGSQEASETPEQVEEEDQRGWFKRFFGIGG